MPAPTCLPWRLTSDSSNKKTRIKPSPVGGNPFSPSNVTNQQLDNALGRPSQVEQPESVRKLISNGGFLLKGTITGLNRSVFSVLFIWTLTLSGLIAATSLAAYLYRMLDSTSCQTIPLGLGYCRPTQPRSLSAPRDVPDLFGHLGNHLFSSALSRSSKPCSMVADRDGDRLFGRSRNIDGFRQYHSRCGVWTDWGGSE